MVGGGILLHGLPFAPHGLHPAVQMLADAFAGVIAGALTLAAVAASASVARRAKRR